MISYILHWLADDVALPRWAATIMYLATFFLLVALAFIFWFEFTGNRELDKDSDSDGK